MDQPQQNQKEKPQEKEVSWFRPDLSYEHLNQIKLDVSAYAGQNDLIAWYTALESEYRFIWNFIEEFAKKADKDNKYFEDSWNNIRALLFDIRYERETVASDKLKSRNFAIARTILHDTNMLLNKFEGEANLIIQQQHKRKKGLAGLSEKYKLKPGEKK